MRTPSGGKCIGCVPDPPTFPILPAHGPIRPGHHRRRGRGRVRGLRGPRAWRLGGDHRARPVRRRLSVLAVHAIQGTAACRRGPSRWRRVPVAEGIGLSRLHDQSGRSGLSGRHEPRQGTDQGRRGADPGRGSLHRRPIHSWSKSAIRPARRGRWRPAAWCWPWARTPASRPCRGCRSPGTGPTARAPRCGSCPTGWWCWAAGRAAWSWGRCTPATACRSPSSTRATASTTGSIRAAPTSWPGRSIATAWRCASMPGRWPSAPVRASGAGTWWSCRTAPPRRVRRC